MLNVPVFLSYTRVGYKTECLNANFVKEYESRKYTFNIVGVRGH